jgi:CII-binding regulator of phage lambda lysogenization HflD
MILEEAKKKYLEGQPYWAADLMVELENKQEGKSLEWAVECMTALVENTSSPNQAQLLTWLSDLLLQSKEDSVEQSALRELSDRIWHDQRDLFHTAIAHLYAALAHLFEKNISRYRTSLVWAMDVMGGHDYYRRTSVAMPLALFENLTKQE